jgi:hypothetical protein
MNPAASRATHKLHCLHPRLDDLPQPQPTPGAVPWDAFASQHFLERLLAHSIARSQERSQLLAAELQVARVCHTLP